MDARIFADLLIGSAEVRCDIVNEGCPILCELPEKHGRLIDADFLQDIMWHSLNADKTGARYCVIKFLGNTPTIIEAEGEHDGK